MDGIALTGMRPAATSPSPSGDEVAHMLEAATSSGIMHSFVLAQQVSRLPSSDQQAAVHALDARLTPQQQGELRRGVDQIKQDASSLPRQYVRDQDGKLEFSPAYQVQACRSYQALMASNDRIGQFTGLPATVGTVVGGASPAVRNSMGGRVLGPLGVMAGIAGLVTTLTDMGAKPPPGCK